MTRVHQEIDITRQRVRRQAERLYRSPFATETIRRDARAVLDGHAYGDALELLRREMGAEVVE